MPDIADYNSDSSGVIFSEAGEPFAIYLCVYLNDPENTYRFNVTLPQQDNPGTNLSSQPIASPLVAEGCLNIIRLLKKTKSWPKIKEQLASMLASE